MTGRIYTVILFTKRFHCSADFAFQTRSQSVFTDYKWVVRRLFGSILISYTSDVS